MYLIHTASDQKAKSRVGNFYPPPAARGAAPWTIEVFDAADSAERLERHRHAAEQCYAARDLKVVAGIRNSIGGSFPTLVIEASQGGPPIGGAQMHMADLYGALPLQKELEPYIDGTAFQDFVRALAPQGIVHLAGLWVAQSHRQTGLAGDIGRGWLVLVAIANARHYVAVCHQHTLAALRSIGCKRVPFFGAFPYPDARYQSCVVLGDVTRLPDDLADWAYAQADEVRRVGLPALKLEPMRASIRAAAGGVS